MPVNPGDLAIDIPRDDRAGRVADNYDPGRRSVVVGRRRPAKSRRDETRSQSRR